MRTENVNGEESKERSIAQVDGPEISETLRVSEAIEANIGEGSSSVPIYRLYMSTNGEHLYTTDANEVRVLTSEHGWIYEGTGWYAPGVDTPVYRLYNSVLQNHLYTTDTWEVEVLTKQHGWVKDNNGYPLFCSGGSIDIFRLYNYGPKGQAEKTTIM